VTELGRELLKYARNRKVKIMFCGNLLVIFCALSVGLFALIDTSEAGVDVCANPKWELQFEDDFESPNSFRHWLVYNGKGHDGNGVRSPYAVNVQNDQLIIEARSEEGINVSGGMRLIGYNQTYGKYVVKVRTEEDRSSVTSGVVLTWPVSQSKKMDGEIDFYETMQEPNNRSEFYSFIHRPGKPYGIGHRSVHSKSAIDWRVIEMQWTDAFIKILVDGAIATEIYDKNIIPNESNSKHFLAMQLDVKSKRKIVQNVRFYVDWVRLYSFEGCH